MKLVVALGLLLAGCYSPHYKDCEIGCATGSCPTGLHCIAGQCRTDPNASNVCGALDDGGLDGPGTDIDASGSRWNAATLLLDGMPNDSGPTLRDDLLEIYFVRNLDLWHATRLSATATFSSPATDFQLSNSSAQVGPDLSPAGTKLYYAEDATGTQRNIMHASRSSTTTTFGNGAVLTALSPTGINTDPTLSGDGSVVIWERPLDTVPLMTADLDPTTMVYVNPRQIAESATWGSKPTQPMLSDDKLTLYFSALNGTQYDLYETHRMTVTGQFGTPVLITDVSSPNADERDPWISADGKVMVFLRVVNGLPSFMQATRI